VYALSRYIDPVTLDIREARSYLLGLPLDARLLAHYVRKLVSISSVKVDNELFRPTQGHMYIFAVRVEFRASTLSLPLYFCYRTVYSSSQELIYLAYYY
jgi:hypothetical protein